MKQSIFTIKENVALTDTVYKMVLSGDTSDITNCGQFVNIKLDGLFLRRPISVCDCENDDLTLIYKVVGTGTEQMCRMAKGDALDILTGLGNGYDTSLSGNAPLLLGGGVGVPPMYMLCKELISQGKKVSVVLGFNKADEMFYNIISIILDNIQTERIKSWQTIRKWLSKLRPWTLTLLSGTQT
mgnify:CR=1 FL=1